MAIFIFSSVNSCQILLLFFVNSCKFMLALADDFRTLRWEEVFKEPEVALGQIRELVK